MQSLQYKYGILANFYYYSGQVSLTHPIHTRLLLFSSEWNDSQTHDSQSDATLHPTSRQSKSTLDRKGKKAHKEQKLWRRK